MIFLTYNKFYSKFILVLRVCMNHKWNHKSGGYTRYLYIFCYHISTKVIVAHSSAYLNYPFHFQFSIVPYSHAQQNMYFLKRNHYLLVSLYLSLCISLFLSLPLSLSPLSSLGWFIINIFTTL